MFIHARGIIFLLDQAVYKHLAVVDFFFYLFSLPNTASPARKRSSKSPAPLTTEIQGIVAVAVGAGDLDSLVVAAGDGVLVDAEAVLHESGDNAADARDLAHRGRRQRVVLTRVHVEPDVFLGARDPRSARFRRRSLALHVLADPDVAVDAQHDVELVVGAAASESAEVRHGEGDCGVDCADEGGEGAAVGTSFVGEAGRGESEVGEGCA